MLLAELLVEKAPPGREKQVKELKKKVRRSVGGVCYCLGPT